MWAIGALVAFIVAFVLHLAGGKTGGYWVDAELIGFILLSVALLFSSPLPWRRAA